MYSPSPTGSTRRDVEVRRALRHGRGERIFSIGINGDMVDLNFDIFSAAGGAYTAISRSYPIVVGNGTLEIDFYLGSMQDREEVDAIEIVAVPDGGS